MAADNVTDNKASQVTEVKTGSHFGRVELRAYPHQMTSCYSQEKNRSPMTLLPEAEK
jgi:hypothetical protein